TQDQNATPVRVFDTATWREIKRLEQAGNFSAGFSPDGRWLVTTGANRVRLFDTATWYEQHSFDHERAVSRMSFSPDGRRLVTWLVPLPHRLEDQPRVWDIDSQREVTLLSGDQEHNSGKSEKELSTDQTQKAAKEPSVDKSTIDAWPKVEWAGVQKGNSPD